MRAPVLFHLGWRLRTIGCLPMFLIAMGMFTAAVGLLASAVKYAGQYLGWELDLARTDSTLAGGVALGWVLAWTVHELLACPFTATLPGFRRRLAIESLAFLAGAAALLWIAMARRTVPRADTLASAHAAVWFLGSGIGLFVANPGRVRRPLAAAAICVAVIVAQWCSTEAVRWILDHPWSGTLLAATAGTAFTFAAFSANEHRQLLSFAPVPAGVPELDPRVLDTSFRMPQQPGFLAPAWNASIGQGRAWVRGTLHDLHGASMGGWIAHSLVWSLAAALLVCLLSLAPDGEPPYSAGQRWAALARNALTAGDRFWVVGLVWVVLASAWILSVPAIPRSEFVRPWSRAERAAATWNVCALRSGLMIGTLLPIVLGIGALAYSNSDLAGLHTVATNGVPDVVAAVLILAVLAPWVAWLRLRLLDLRAVHGGFPDPIRQAVVVVAAIAASLCAAWVLGAGWHSLKQVHIAVAGGLFLGAVAGSWAAFRSVLERLFRRADLRV